MCLASFSMRPSARDLATRSDPARSTRFSLDLVNEWRGGKGRSEGESGMREVRKGRQWAG